MSSPMYEMAWLLGLGLELGLGCRAMSRPMYRWPNAARKRVVCGVVWRGVAWRGVVWCAVVRRGVAAAVRCQCVHGARACFFRSVARALLEKQPSPTGRSM